MSELAAIYGNQTKSRMLYDRDGDLVSISLRGMTNHEIRDVLVGLWARLNEDDRRDHVRALAHYLEPGSVMPYVARLIATAEQAKRH